MSVNIATMGMFKDCCSGGGTGFGGGAPPYRQYDEHVAPVVFIRRVEMVSLKDPEDYKKITVKLKDD
jgi:hypothetical protein